MKTTKLEHILSFVAILLPTVFASLVYQELPDGIAIHYNMSGEANLLLTKDLALFAVPVGMVVIQAGLLFSLTKKEVANKGFQTFLMWVLPVSFFILQMSIFYRSLGYSLNIPRVSLIVVGFILIMIGNYLPKQVLQEQATVAPRMLAYTLIVIGFVTLVLSWFL